MRFLNPIMAALFLLSAAVQFNDPDPIQWIAIYTAAALACILATGVAWKVRGPHGIERAPGNVRAKVRLLSAFTGIAAFIWAAFLLPEAFRHQAPLSLPLVFGSAEMMNERVELVREIGGLSIVAFWMLVVFFGSRERPVQETNIRSV